MALVTEVFRFAMHQMAVQALKIILIVRRHVRVRRLDGLSLFNQGLLVMTLRAGFDRWFLRISFIRTMTACARDTHRRMAISTELLISGLGNAKAEHCAKEDREVERGLQHVRFPLVDSFFRRHLRRDRVIIRATRVFSIRAEVCKKSILWYVVQKRGSESQYACRPTKCRRRKSQNSKEC